MVCSCHCHCQLHLDLKFQLRVRYYCHSHTRTTLMILPLGAKGSRQRSSPKKPSMLHPELFYSYRLVEKVRVSSSVSDFQHGLYRAKVALVVAMCDVDMNMDVGCHCEYVYGHLS